MRLTQLQYLIEIKKHGSISKAAQHLFIAQPSMSTAIRELENELGYELMKRSKKGVSFTSLGELAVEKAENILREVEMMRCLDEVETGRMVGRLFLSAVPFVCEHFVLDMLVELSEKHPDLHIILDENDGAMVLQQVSRWEADLGIIMICNNEEERFQQEMLKNGVAFKELYRDELCFLVGVQHSLYKQEIVELSEILTSPYVYYKGGFTEDDQNFFARYCDIGKLTTVCMKDRESVKKYVVRSKATTILPVRATMDNIYIQSGLLSTLKLNGAPWTCKVGVVYRKDMPLSREARFIIESIKNIVKQ